MFDKVLLFLSATWLPHEQLSATVEEAASVTWCWSLRLLLIWPKGHQEPLNEVGPNVDQAPSGVPSDSERDPSDSESNGLT